MSVPQYAALASASDAPAGSGVPNAWTLRTAARYCCSICIRNLSRLFRWTLVDVFALLAQKPPRTALVPGAVVARSSDGPQSFASAEPVTGTATMVLVPGGNGVPFQMASVRAVWVAQKPWVRVVPPPCWLLVKVQTMV